MLECIDYFGTAVVTPHSTDTLLTEVQAVLRSDALEVQSVIFCFNSVVVYVHKARTF